MAGAIDCRVLVGNFLSQVENFLPMQLRVSPSSSKLCLSRVSCFPGKKMCRNQSMDFMHRSSSSEMYPSTSSLEARAAYTDVSVEQEIQKCYQLIHRLGRGVVYLGSSRITADHPHYEQSFELGREIAKLLDCTSWSGVGPGLMDAVVKGALEAGKPVGGLKIAREAGEWIASSIHPYLPPETYLTCRFFSARKHGLVDAAMRNSSSDRTAIVALPGGIGTLDELFEILTLFQLQRMGSKFPVPFLLMNYDSFYSKLLDFLDDCKQWGTVSEGEVPSLWKVCSGNREALDYLSQFYHMPRVW